MKSHRYVVALVAMSLAGSTGCAPSDDPNGQDLEVSLQPQAGSYFYEPPRGRNGLKPSEFWSDTAQLAYRDMQHIPLKNGTIDVLQTDGTFITYPLLNAPPGSPLATLLVTYPKAAIDLIECALDDTQKIYDPNTAMEIQGWFGLAPNWENSPISTQIDVQEWLTGCMIARLNKWGIQVDILLEGDTPAIQTDPALDLIAQYEESTVHGNMFNSSKPVSNSAPAFSAYLCRENYLAGACPNDQGAGFMYQRICDNAPIICGLVDIGRCDPTTTTLPACVANGPQHWKCKEGLSGTIHKFRTVGVQLENPIEKSSCD